MYVCKPGRLQAVDRNIFVPGKRGTPCLEEGTFGGTPCLEMDTGYYLNKGYTLGKVRGL